MGMQFLIRPSGRTFLMAVCMAALFPDPSLHSQVPVQSAPKTARKASAAAAQYVGPTVPDVRGQTCDQAKQTLLSEVHLVGRCIGELVEGAVVSDQLPVAGSPARGVRVVELTLTVPAPPPVPTTYQLSLTGIPQAARVGDTIEATASLQPLTNATYRFDWGDGTLETISESTRTHVYASPCECGISVTALEDNEVILATSDTVQIRIEQSAVGGPESQQNKPPTIKEPKAAPVVPHPTPSETPERKRNSDLPWEVAAGVVALGAVAEVLRRVARRRRVRRRMQEIAVSAKTDAGQQTIPQVPRVRGEDAVLIRAFPSEGNQYLEAADKHSLRTKRGQS
ncbi:MAG: PKD domain-containing protein [Acidobacteriia bacterium]|nr:PKD domain-containing protein [Terriglobia bacterium]